MSVKRLLRNPLFRAGWHFIDSTWGRVPLCLLVLHVPWISVNFLGPKRGCHALHFGAQVIPRTALRDKPRWGKGMAKIHPGSRMVWCDEPLCLCYSKKHLYILWIVLVNDVFNGTFSMIKTIVDPIVLVSSSYYWSSGRLRAMENGPKMDDLWGFTAWKWWFSIAMLNYQMVSCHCSPRFLFGSIPVQKVWLMLNWPVYPMTSYTLCIPSAVYPLHGPKY